MARTEGRHRITRRTKIATALSGLVVAAGGVAFATTTTDTGNANADPVDKAFFVDITTVAPNVKAPQNARGASTGTFTVNCGKNENGHFNPDNFIAQPGVRNGAQHLHDYVGNLTTNADSTNESLLAGGTTCKNGDQSAYFWPVVRIDRGDEEETNAAQSPEETQVTAERAQAQANAQTPQVDCPDVASQIDDMSDAAAATVETELNAMDQELDAANQQMAAATDEAAQNQVLQPLRDKRRASIERINRATRQQVGRGRDLSGCGVKNRGRGHGRGGKNTATSSGAAATTTPPAETTTTTAAATTTTDTTTTADTTTAAGTTTTADTTTTDSSTSAAATTTSSELPGPDENNEVAGNDGEIQQPATVSLTFRGSPATKVRAMPQFLRVLSGDAKEGANGPTNARAAWTCTGFEDRLIDKYPICPEGSKVERIHDFPSCWDGQNTDSANHRTHIVFPDANGKCGNGFVAVPQLRVTLTYDIPHDVQVAGQYKVDSFPEEHHNPLSDHDDFANVMSQCIMWRLVTCVNGGRNCKE
ncbi:DUF1996 domain-containing protein [Amycolatopsis sp.]|uniref:DUF1996 domain-containing protein n=1 Tax=Amycolatopsis sp. TaxID=37632 RepID=UPI002C21CDBD|nr:DUF1996 domain-containing protein [Amycolatopsis sp.]HVV10038.1 DUF1996 domain-containing protein [Amycolatopsis sp.]